MHIVAYFVHSSKRKKTEETRGRKKKPKPSENGCHIMQSMFRHILKVNKRSFVVRVIPRPVHSTATGRDENKSQKTQLYPFI